MDLSDEGMDIDDLNEPLTVNDIITTIESRIGLDKNSAESLKPQKQVLDDVLEYGVGQLETEIGIDSNKIGIVGPAVSELIMQGEDLRDPESHLKACRNMLEGTMKDQENTIFFINYNKNIDIKNIRLEKTEATGASCFTTRKKTSSFTTIQLPIQIKNMQ